MRFAERLVKHAAEARNVMIPVGGSVFSVERVDGYVLLGPDEAIHVAELVSAAWDVVHDAEVGGGDYEHLLIPNLRAKLLVLDPR